MSANDVWTVVWHPKGDLAMLPLSTVCEFNRIARLRGEPGYEPVATAQSMKEAGVLKREIRHEFREGEKSTVVGCGVGSHGEQPGGDGKGGQGGGEGGVRGGNGFEGGGRGAGMDGEKV